MDLAQRISKLSPQQRKLLELKLKEKNVDILQIPITRVSREDHKEFPLSFAQERLWFLDRLEPGTPVYNIAKATKLDGPLNNEILEKSIQEIVRRHDIFRVVFVLEHGDPLQVILPELSIPLFIKDFKNIGKEQRDAAIKQYLQQESQHSFDLAHGPLLKPQLLELDENESIFLLLTHHIIADGVSVQVFLKELAQIYAAFSRGQECPLQELPIQYVDYTCWQRQWFQPGGEVSLWHKRQEDYWLEQFAGGVPVLNLPMDFPRPLMQSFEGNTFYFALDSHETASLKDIAIREKTTLYVVLLAAFNIFLAKLGGMEDIVVGTPVAGRRHSALQDLIGMFVNTLILRNRPVGDKTVREFFAEVSECTLRAFENQEYRYEDIVNKVNVGRDTGRNPLFDVMFSLENLETSEVTIPDLNLKEYDYEVKSSKFDITYIVREQQGILHFSVEYCTKLFKEDTILRFIGYFKQVIHSVLEDKECAAKLSEIEILPDEEKEKLLVRFNNTETVYPTDKTIHELFEDRVEKVSDHIALIFEEKKISYKELNERANRLAGSLLNMGVTPGVLVGIFSHRRLELMTAIFAVLKAGAVYLPLDPNHPEKRITYMLKASNVSIVLTDNRLLTGTLFSFLDLVDEASYESNWAGAPVLNNPGNPAYVIYTSGTTGLPKGVVIEHRSVVNFMKGMTDVMDFRTEDRVLSLTTISFDIFGLETIVPLSRGCAVVIGSDEKQMDPGVTGRGILRENITIFQVTPSRLQLILFGGGAADSLRFLRYLQVGGEAFPQGLLDQVRLLAGSSVRIFNLYGPTETTIYSTWKDLTGEGQVTIGKPIANTVSYILDKYLNPVPIGVWGEIYIGGHGVARGYLNNPGLTEEKFIKSFSRGSGGRFFKKAPLLYKTGDLGRWLPDGDIELSGRIDFQVKIRGFRIELAEIEKRLSQYENVKEAVVTARSDESGNKYLCAYYVPVEAEAGAIDIGELREFLGLELPEYMVPSYFVSLKEMPLTASRKIDRQALPDPVRGRAQVGSAYLAPQSDLEKQIAEQWMKVLNLDKVGIHDNFFNLGGDSMKIVRLNSRLKEVLGRDISVVSMFRHVTISSFARYLIEEGSEAAISGKEEQRRQKVEALDRSKNIFKNTLTRSQRGKI